MVEKCPPRVAETKYGGAMSMLKQKRKPLPLRNEAQLNCVSLRSELDWEVTCGAVKGQDERPFRAPLTAPQVTPELSAARKKTSKVSRQDRQNGGTVGRPSCQSSLLSDPNAKFSVEMWRKPPRTRKVKKPRNGGTVELTCQTHKKNGDQTKEGRHVGLDFYDLLIEALIDRSKRAIA